MLQYPVPYAYPLCYSATYLADCGVAIFAFHFLEIFQPPQCLLSWVVFNVNL